MKTIFTTVLWGRLCDKGPKVFKHKSLNDALKFLKRIEPSLPEGTLGGDMSEIMFFELDGLIASIVVRFEPTP